jgi:hypothetical protein
MEARKFKDRQVGREVNSKRGRHGGKKIHREAGMEGRTVKVKSQERGHLRKSRRKGCN